MSLHMALSSPNTMLAWPPTQVACVCLLQAERSPLAHLYLQEGPPASFSSSQGFSPPAQPCQQLNPQET